MDLKLNQIVWLEDISDYRYISRSWSIGLTDEERWIQDLSKGEVVKIDGDSYYIMIKKYSDNKIIELDIHNPSISKDYRLWVNKDDFLKMKMKQKEISDLKNRAKDILDNFTEFELLDFIKLNSKS